MECMEPDVSDFHRFGTASTWKSCNFATLIKELLRVRRWALSFCSLIKLYQKPVGLLYRSCQVMKAKEMRTGKHWRHGLLCSKELRIRQWDESVYASRANPGYALCGWSLVKNYPLVQGLLGRKNEFRGGLGLVGFLEQFLLILGWLLVCCMARGLG